MTLRRVWLDWSRPCLPAAAEWLIGDRQEPQSPNLQATNDRETCDLRNTICVLPGKRAGRVLLAQLIERCEAGSLRLIPPEILTPGAMLDALLEIDQPLASEMESTFAWINALQNVDPD